MPLPIIALAIAAFGIGTTEFVIMGLLPEMAADLQVTIPQAGMLVTGYALGVVVGGPILAVISARWPRKPTLIALTCMFVIGNVACALAPGYYTLMAARVLTSLSHGAFFGIGAVTAASLVPPEKRGHAISLMFAGLTLANVLGVPFGTALGQAFGWRSTFAAVTLIGVVALVALWRWVPGRLPRSHGRIIGEFTVLRQKPVLLALGMSVLASVSMFSVFTYITPMLNQVTGVGGHTVTLFLLVYGVGLTFGSLLGGRLSGGKLMPPMIKLMAGVVAILVIFWLTLADFWIALATMFIWGMFAFALVPLLQLLIVDQSAEAPNLASTLNQSAFNLGNAIGATLGGVVIDAGLPYGRLPLFGALLMLFALGVAVYTLRMFKHRAARERASMQIAENRA
ncbi:MFS transporter [Halotalea alkalilenta]|uniref:Arabinose transporter permease n=1 Tax=Halotalea alkalilenta TaxID=376489 RepID=A0A172YCT3_9GAMM|nr:MFS transporter [Halotalea alkalilenta]ANF56805.1 arabinose transporter permease [Halotalea alkalilenta]